MSCNRADNRDDQVVFADILNNQTSPTFGIDRHPVNDRVTDVLLVDPLNQVLSRHCFFDQCESVGYPIAPGRSIVGPANFRDFEIIEACTLGKHGFVGDVLDP